MISFNKLSELLPAFTCGRAIGNVSRIYLGVNIFSPVPLVSLIFASDIIKLNNLFPCFVKHFNIVKSVFLFFWFFYFFLVFPFFISSSSFLKSFWLLFASDRLISRSFILFVRFKALSNLSSFTSEYYLCICILNHHY